MKRGFRTRLTVTVIGLVVVAAAVVSVSSYLLVRTSLREQLVTDSLELAQFNVLELASSEVLPNDADREIFEETGLAERFLRRGTSGVYVDFGDGDPYASEPGLLATPTLASPGVASLVDEGRIGYEFLEVAGEPALVVGARRPSGPPDFFLYFDAGVVDRALGDLLRFLMVGVGLVIVVAVVTAGAVSRGVLRPVRSASAAAGRLAEGDLTTRVPVRSDDEFGRMAESFNSMAAAREAQIEALEEAEARERRFVADVSHELRTPVTGLYNEAQLLEANLAGITGPARRAAELLIGDVDRLRRLVDELLEISRLESGPGHVDPVETDVDRFLSAIISERLPTAQLVGSPLGVIGCDRQGLERIVGNLLDNAAAHAPGARVEVEARVADGGLVVSVTDDGPGAEPESLPHLFERFYKADVSRQGGSGLGLAIALEYARRIGGELTVERGRTGGLRFEARMPVTIPLHHGDEAETPEADDVAETEEIERRMP